MLRIIEDTGYTETFKNCDICDALLAHQISRSGSGSSNYHDFKVIMSINYFLFYLQQL